MFSKFHKVQCVLHFTIKEVDLNKEFPEVFYIQWGRGKTKGETDQKLPDKENILHFNASFECPCTVFISNSDNAIRPKLLRFNLHRHTREGQFKLYGKLAIDIAKYYNKESMCTEKLEMESGRTIAPILEISFLMRQVAESTDASANDVNDISFLDDSPSKIRVPLGEWDQTEVSTSDMAPNEDDSSLRKKHHKKHKKSSKSAKERFYGAQSDDELQTTPARRKLLKEEGDSASSSSNPQRKGTGNEDGESQQRHSDISEKSGMADQLSDQNGEDGEERTKHPKGRKRRGALLPANGGLRKSVSNDNLRGFKEKYFQETLAVATIPENEIHPEAQQSEESSTQVPKGPKADHLKSIQSVLEVKWSCRKPIFIDQDNKVKIPPLVFPLVAVLLEEKVLIPEVPKDEFEDFVKDFKEYYSKTEFIDSSSEERFLTTILIFLILQENIGLYGLDRKRIEQLLAAFQEEIGKEAQKVISVFLLNFEVLANRFSTAKFEVDPLIYDFCHVLGQVQLQLPFSGGINMYLIRHFMSILDARIMKKLIANPIRYTYMNAITWNSFTTAFEQVTRLNFFYLKQFANIIMMGNNVNTDPTMKNEIAPNLDPKLVVYILKNCRPDGLMPRKVEWRQLAEYFQVPNFVSYGQVSPLPVDHFEAAKEKLKLSEWNAERFTVERLDDFPFLSKYLLTP